MSGHRILHHFWVVVSVVVLLPPPSMLTLSSRLWKIKAAPVTLPRAGSVMRGGAAAVPVSTYSSVSPVYTSCSPVPRRPPEVTTTCPRAVMRSTCAEPPSLPAWLPGGSSRSSASSDTDVAVGVSATTGPSAPPRITALCSASEYFRSPPHTWITAGAGDLAVEFLPGTSLAAESRPDAFPAGLL